MREQAPTTVRHLLLRSDFRRLLATRLLSQFGDGVFQAALAGTVLFNPQRAADPVDVAAGFAVLLLPYSLVGPFAGGWPGRWARPPACGSTAGAGGRCCCARPCCARCSSSGSPRWCWPTSAGRRSTSPGS